MKLKSRVLIIAVFGLLVITSCNRGENFIKGDGNIITAIEEVNKFNKIEIDGIFNITLVQAKNESVEIKADSNIVSLVSIEVNAKTLVIKFIKDVSIDDPINITINVNQLKELTTNNIGTIKSDNTLEGKSLAVTNSGVGEINLNLNYNDVDIDNSGVSNVILEGTSSKLNVNNSGVGHIYAFELSSKQVKVNANGVGNIEVNASKKIEIQSSGVGNVTYSGHPTKEDINNSSVGNVTAI